MLATLFKNYLHIRGDTIFDVNEIIGRCGAIGSCWKSEIIIKQSVIFHDFDNSYDWNHHTIEPSHV